MKIDSAIFYSKDLSKAVAFHRDILEFAVEYIQEDRFASFTFENAKLGIKQAKELREVPGHQTVFIQCQDVITLYEALKKKGVAPQEVKDADWAKYFSVSDPDGNKILFAQYK